MPPLKLTPTYWTVTVWPAWAAGPVPSRRSLIDSFFGALPFGSLTVGFLAGAWGVSVADGVAVAAVSGVGVLSELLSSPPQPARARSATSRAMASVRGMSGGEG